MTTVSYIHSKTHAFATLLNSREKWDEQVAEAIAALFGDYSEVKKADLYAMVAERVRPGMPFAMMVNTVNECLLSNERYAATKGA